MLRNDKCYGENENREGHHMGSECTGVLVGFCFKQVVKEIPLLNNSEQGATSKVDHISLILANSRSAHFLDKLRKSPFQEEQMEA